jgi:hypothetical protein
LAHAAHAAPTHSLLLAALGSVHLQLDRLAFPLGANDLGVELELDTLLRQNLLELLAIAMSVTT